jgi:hypothetical protein
MCHIVTVGATQFVSQTAFPRYALMSFCWRKDNPSPTLNKCVFIRGFRAKRRLFWTVPIRAQAEPLPDDPDNSREDDIQVTRVPDAPKVGSLPCDEMMNMTLSVQYRDPLIGVLDYIVEVRLLGNARLLLVYLVVSKRNALRAL